MNVTGPPVTLAARNCARTPVGEPVIIGGGAMAAHLRLRPREQFCSDELRGNRLRCIIFPGGGLALVVTLPGMQRDVLIPLNDKLGPPDDIRDAAGKTA
jgi:hypothetical protein